VWCIVVAGGSGRRWGGAKQFEQLGGRRVIDRSVEVAAAACGGVVAVVPGDQQGRPVTEVAAADVVVVGGSSRSESVRAGLAAVPASAAVVLVHDAARPLATPELFVRVVDAVRAGAAAVVPAVPVVDTVRRVDGGVVDRDQLRAVQTPQGFDAATLRRVHRDGPEASDDAGLVEAAGGRVELVEGERENLKLTDPIDRVVAEALLAARPGLAGRAADTADSVP
jgi:2-C-methyl-D-erythritol 4-phosphate cytidylyltransferase